MKKEWEIVCKTELYKIFKRKDTCLLYTMLLVPALYAIGLASGSTIITYTGNGNITAINFTSAMFQMSQSMFIFNVILAAVSGRTLGTEIEDKSILIYLNRVGDRKIIYMGKVVALTIYSLITDLLLIIFSLIFYYAILNNKTEIVNGAFSDKDSFLEIIQICVIIGFWIITVLFTLFLSTKYRMIVCLGIYMIAYIAMNLLSYVQIVGYLSPLYYITRFTSTNKIILGDILAFAIYILIFSFLLNYAGKRNLDKRDL